MGTEFEFPLFLRKERGELDMARIRLEETTLDRDRKLVEWQNKAKACLFESENLKTQIELMDQTVINYQRLLMAERNRLENGESSLFLVNNRQMKLIEAELKQNELQAKLRKTNVALLWALGIRWRMID
ncbi:MAG: TolC family protein [Saprospiraceae bacterium]|nr:TolC family protein [Saprospiraceae bacterium]